MPWEKAAENIHRILVWAGFYGADNDDMTQGLIVEGLQKGWTPRETTRRVLIKKIGPGGNRRRLRSLAGIGSGPKAHRTTAQREEIQARMMDARLAIQRTRSAPPLTEEQAQTLAARYGITPVELAAYRRAE